MIAANPDAFFAEAIRLLTGQGCARDVIGARAMLRDAADAGHAEAALFEVALAANGSGGPRDWPKALARLRRLAGSGSAVARAHLALIDAMAIDDQGMPTSLPAPEQLSDAPSVWRYRALVTPAECQVIAAAVADILEPASVVDPTTGRLISHPIRTSYGAVVGPTRESLPIAALNRRLAAASGTDLAQGEPLSVLRYGRGDQYRLHHDSFTGAMNQRTRTILVYLNDGYAGGETEFPDLGLRIAGKAGDVVAFDNLDEAGRPEPRARHAGLPVAHGTKWLATRWIREKTVDPWNPETWR